MKLSLFPRIALYTVVCFMLVSVAMPLLGATNSGGDDIYGLNTVNNIQGLGSADPRQIAANVIQIILGFLGIIAVVIILIGGFKWMTALGNDEKVEEAKKLIASGIIGLIIIVSAFAIAKFVIDRLTNITGA